MKKLLIVSFLAFNCIPAYGAFLERLAIKAATTRHIAQQALRQQSVRCVNTSKESLKNKQQQLQEKFQNWRKNFYEYPDLSNIKLCSNLSVAMVCLAFAKEGVMIKKLEQEIKQQKGKRS
jgi:hypothetical protein